MAKAIFVAKALILAIIAAGVVSEIIPTDGFPAFMRGFLSGCAFTGVIAYFNGKEPGRA
jgi:hypothetical protein